MARSLGSTGLGIAVALIVGGSAALAGQSAGEPDAQPARFQHSLKGMFAKTSIALHKRPWYEHALWYLPSRALDLVDIVGLELAAGRGFHANLRATRLLQLGCGRQESTRVGINSRHVGIVDEQLTESAAGWWWRLDLRRDTLRGAARDLDICEADVAARYCKEADPTAVGISLFAGFIGISAELRIHELGDFIKGFATIDSIEDDL